MRRSERVFEGATRSGALNGLPVTTFLLLVLGVLAVDVRLATAQTILNSGFETPTISSGSWEVAPAGGDWVFNTGFSDPSGVSRNSSLYRATDHTPEGLQHAFLRGDSSISQTISGLTVGQTYRIEWDQAFSEAASGGAALAVELSSPGDTQQVLPYTLANNFAWDQRGSDVFVANSENYTLSFLTDDATPDLNSRGALLDDVRIVPVTAPAIQRTQVELDLQLLPGSRVDIEFLLADEPLPGSLGADLTGPLSVDFDAISGVGVVGWHFNREQIDLASDISGQIGLGVLGTADVTLRQGGITLFNEEGVAPHQLHIQEDGDFQLGGTFLEFGGEAEFDLEGPITSIFDDQSLLLSDFSADDLGTLTSNGGSVFNTDLGHVDFDPTGNPNEFLVTIEMPWVTRTTALGSLDLDIQVTGNILAQGTVTFTAPEPSTHFLLLSGAAICLAAGRKKRRGNFAR